MNGQTFSQNPRKRVKSHNAWHYALITKFKVHGRTEHGEDGEIVRRDREEENKQTKEKRKTSRVLLLLDKEQLKS